MRTKFNKTTGPRPDKKLIEDAAFLVRSRTKSCIAVAMTMRPGGATQSEIIGVLGKPHRNVIRRLIDRQVVRQHVLPDHTRSTRIRLVRNA